MQDQQASSLRSGSCSHVRIKFLCSISITGYRMGFQDKDPSISHSSNRSFNLIIENGWWYIKINVTLHDVLCYIKCFKAHVTGVTWTMLPLFILLRKRGVFHLIMDSNWPKVGYHKYLNIFYRYIWQFTYKVTFTCHSMYYVIDMTYNMLHDVTCFI